MCRIIVTTTSFNMACSKDILDQTVDSLEEKQYDEEDLTMCSICLATIEKPKALPCLHTYCFKCLSEWAKSTSKTVTCPICRKVWTLPTDGVAGLEKNFLVTKLKDRKTVHKKLASKDCKIPCSSCDGSGQPAVARCVECDDFLCENCLKSHKTMRALKGHHTFSLDELRSGKADPVEKANYCIKHTDQVLWIYCETCGMLICRDCTVFDHCKPDHKFVDLQSAVESQKAKIEELAEDCQNLAVQVEEAIKNDMEAAIKLDTSVENGMEELSQAYQETKSAILMQLEANYNALASEIKNKGARGRKEIDTHTEELNVLRSRLRTALKTASELTKTGSDSDVAQMYASLTGSMQDLCDIKKPPVQTKRMEEVIFKANKTNQPVVTIGSVSSEIKELTAECKNWKYQRQINSKGTGIISDISLVNGNVDEICIVHNGQQAYKVTKGSTFVAIPKKESYPWGCISNEKGEIFLTARDTYVYKFSSNLTFLRTYSIPSGRQALGITMIPRNNRIVVGEHNNKCISLHSEDGTLTSQFNVTVHPWYISVDSQDHLAISCWGSCCKSVIVVDINKSGQVLFTLNAPANVKEWNPKGVCWSKGDVLFVVNYDGEKGVHQFTSSGAYVRCIIEGLGAPTCLTISNKDELLVADNSCIKMYN
ncbi:uncharacterized protein [Amphiura filiformis]|uniref:uncharacterized protein n=1 Tax=Amphiura filiformis TaxID=82378 RepID=UPI003B20F15A